MLLAYAYGAMPWPPGTDTLRPSVMLSLIHISEPTRPYYVPYPVFCLQ